MPDLNFWVNFLAQVGIATVILFSIGYWFAKYGFPFIQKRVERGDVQLTALEEDRKAARQGFLDALERRDREGAAALKNLSDSLTVAMQQNNQALVNALSARDQALMNSLVDRDHELVKSIREIVDRSGKRK